MPISSLIIRTKEESTSDINGKLFKLESVAEIEQHGENLIAVTDTKDQEEDKVLWEAIESMPGVLQCDLIYHNFEDTKRGSL